MFHPQKTIHMSVEDYNKIRYASMVGKFSYDYVRDDNFNVEFQFALDKVNKLKFYEAIEKIVDFGASGAKQVFEK